MSRGVEALLKLGEVAVTNRYARKFLLNTVEKRIHEDLIEKNPDDRPLKVQEDKWVLGKALLHSVDRAFSKGLISRAAARGLLQVFLGNVFFGGFYKRRSFIEKHGFKPPMFITISPNKSCNLKCIGCYANADAEPRKLPYEAFDGIIKDAKESWGSNFFVISGGEPLMYRDKNKTMIDVARTHNDCYFLMYTNGTLVDEKMAKSLAAVGNITPAISVEGFREETDARRGDGVFDKIVRAMENLRNCGVPFGISVTVTNENIKRIVDEKFLDFYFEKQGAIYGWYFHYMPIGRGYTLELLPSPEDRVWLLNEEWRLVKEKNIFLVDFWNSGTASDGCISAARGGGYFYIDWDGNVCPCVFVPYYIDNIVELYKNGKNLDDAIQSGLFKRIRKWQAEYGYEKPRDQVGNWFRQCPIRDHYKVMHKILTQTKARANDPSGESALKDDEYLEGLAEYGEIIEKLTGEKWDREYLLKDSR